MGISIDQYRIAIGCFTSKCSKNLLFFWYFLFPKFVELYLILLLRKISNDIETNPGPIKICQANVQSLMALPQGTARAVGLRPPKLIELEALVQFESIDILCLSESWLSNDYSDKDINISNMTKIYRRDRGSRGGGVAIFARDSLVVKRLKHIEPSESEIICLDVQLPNSPKHILLTQCYRPDTRNVLDFSSDLLDIHDFSVQSNYYMSVYVGDFNGKNDRWYVYDKTNTEGSILQSVIENMNCVQVVDFPTRFRNDKTSCLDLLFTNRDNLISDLHSSSPIGKSDHVPVIFEIKCNYPKIKKFTRNIWNLQAGNSEELNRHLLNLDWETILDTNDANISTNRWYNLFIQVADLYIPHKTITINNDDLPYMTRRLKKLIRTKDKYFKIYQSSGLESDHDIYKFHRNTLTYELRQAESKYYDQLSQDLLINQTNSKMWWKLIKKTTSNTGSALHETPILDNDILIYDDKGKAQAFNKFFTTSVQTENKDDPIPIDHNLLYYPKIPSITINEVDVYELLKKLDTSKATGPDNISNALLKHCSLSLAKPLCIIFNLSLKTGVFPLMWKSANVTPIFKNKGDKKNCDFYRPISLLPCVSKVFEKLMFSHIYEFLRKNKIIVPNQSGFTAGDSAIFQISHIIDKMLRSMDHGQEVTAIFLDLAKAFDIVWRKGLIFKLDRVGIRNSNDCKMLDWFSSYLSERSQKVVLNGIASDSMFNDSGVPQGSVLGPLLFLIYINDLVHGLKCQSYLFADDTSLFDTSENVYDSIPRLASDLSFISSWAKKWKIKINASKTEGLIINKKANPSPYVIPKIQLNGCQVNFVNEHKHVGIWLNKKLDWKTHISNLASKANSRMGILRKFKYKLPRVVLNQCYLSYVRPLMEYGGALFANEDDKDLKLLDDIQMEALHIVSGAKKKTSHELLKKEANWPDLSLRRTFQQVIFLHKIIHNKYPTYLYKSLPPMRDQSNRPERKYKFNTPHFDHAFYRDSIIPSSISNWNELPNHIRTIVKIDTFKLMLKREYLEPPKPLYHYGERFSQMSHARIRVKFSNLNFHLYNYNLVESPNCRHCNLPETPNHYFFICNKFSVERTKLLQKIERILRSNNINNKITLELLLHGTEKLSYTLNTQIIDAVHSFIRATGRNP